MPLLEKLLEGKITQCLAREAARLDSSLGEAHRWPVSECKGLSENPFRLSRQYLPLADRGGRISRHRLARGAGYRLGNRFRRNGGLSRGRGAGPPDPAGCGAARV